MHANGPQTALFLLLILLLLAANVLAAEEDLPVVARLEIVGASEVKPGTLRSLMLTKQRRWWQPFSKPRFYGMDYLQRDLERLVAYYHAEGYLFAHIDSLKILKHGVSAVGIEIYLTEGPRVRIGRVALEGFAGELESEATDALGMHSGDPLREEDLLETRQRLLSICANRGYAASRVDCELSFRADSVDVRFRALLGPMVRVRRVLVDGLSRTRPSVVRREVRFRRGEVFDPRRAERFQERLFALGIFRAARIYPMLADSLLPRGELAVDVMVSVSEKKPGWYGFGFGFSSSDRITASGEWGYRNVAGRARRLRVRAESSVGLEKPREGLSRQSEHSLELSYFEPWLFGTPTRGRFGSYVRYDREATFDERSFGLTLEGSHEVAEYAQVSLSLENKWVRTTDEAAPRPSYSTRFLSLAFGYDSRDFVLDPHSGLFGVAAVEYAGGFLGGEVTFARLRLAFSHYVTLPEGSILAYRLQWGLVEPIGCRGDVCGEGLERIPFEERFQAGGGTTVRGYSEDSLGPVSSEGQNLGGLALALANIELRFPLAGRVGGVLFLDSGNVWESYKDIKASRWSAAWKAQERGVLDVAYSIGVGVRVRTPVGPVGLDYGVKLFGGGGTELQRGQWHLSLGQAF